MSREQNGARSFPHLSALRLTLRGPRPYRPPAIVCYLSPVCLNTHSFNGGHDLKKSFSLWARLALLPGGFRLTWTCDQWKHTALNVTHLVKVTPWSYHAHLPSHYVHVLSPVFVQLNGGSVWRMGPLSLLSAYCSEACYFRSRKSWGCQTQGCI